MVSLFFWLHCTLPLEGWFFKRTRALTCWHTRAQFYSLTHIYILAVRTSSLLSIKRGTGGEVTQSVSMNVFVSVCMSTWGQLNGFFFHSLSRLNHFRHLHWSQAVMEHSGTFWAPGLFCWYPLWHFKRDICSCVLMQRWKSEGDFWAICGEA